ncbi:SDR family oxidoreductase [Martelella mediterranea]|uniref:SDR family NAD(P)-dependent oxidoreductase n=1 Tax=Martelella mediterranea TaxID=293089 RepID=UPI001E5D8685|nr:SDR family oxidoreductase [Martelella mediterranea]MCD1634036.1 SDR family oxidoreductase [Martelella mediterranea]
MFEDLKRKTVLITGASSGLGAGFAEIFARHGARLALAARRVEKLEALQRKLVDGGADVQVVALDVTDENSVEAAVNAVTPHIDILVNNAGVATFGRSLEISASDWDKTLDTNLRGLFLVAQAVARRMEREGTGGSIVNISSITALRASRGLAAYSASKAGASHLTKCLALDWAAHGIRVNALCPGYIETEMNAGFFETPEGLALIARTPMKKIGRISDLEGPLLLLASDAGRHITGIDLPVDGGHLVSSL